MKEIKSTTQMLIRKPVAEVFEAFIDPKHTTQFWFTHSTGKLEEEKTIIWKWEMYNVSSEVKVNKIIPNEMISIVWGEQKENVDFTFSSSKDETATYVVIHNYGFSEKDEALLSKLIDTTGGFTTVLDGAKCWLEHGFSLNLIKDKFPEEFMGG